MKKTIKENIIKEIVKRIDSIESFERWDWNKNQKYLDFPEHIRTAWLVKDTNFLCCSWMGSIYWEDIETEEVVTFEEVFESCPDNVKEDLIFNMDIFNASSSKNFYGVVQG